MDLHAVVEFHVDLAGQDEVDVQRGRLPGHRVGLGGGIHVAGAGDVKERADPHRVRGGDDAHGAGREQAEEVFALVQKLRRSAGEIA